MMGRQPTLALVRASALAMIICTPLACTDGIATDLDDDTSHTIVAELRHEGIDAERVRSAGGWRIEVPSHAVQRGREIADRTLGCPPLAAPDEPGLARAILGPDLQARADSDAYRQGARLRSQLQALDGVACATVTVRARPPTIARPTPTTGAVVALQVGAHADRTALRNQVQRTADGLDLRLSALTFAAVPKSTPESDSPQLARVGPWRVDAADAASLRVVLGGGLAACVLAVVLGARTLLRRRRGRA